MNVSAWIALAAVAVTLLLAMIAVVVWLVRLEGQNTANAVAIANLTQRLNAHGSAQDSSKIEIVRLQEQIKHLTDLIERWLAPPERQRTSKAPEVAS